MNLILYGPPGVGKTVLGKELAAHMKRKFFCCDPLIEERAGKSIPQIFAEDGEAEFRRLEAEMCAELARQREAVISVGGGAFLNERNRVALERGSLVICLRVDVDTLLERLSSSGHRPLVAGENPRAKLEALLKKRQALYDSFSIQLDTKDKTLKELVKEIMVLLEPHMLSVKSVTMQHDILIGYELLKELPQVLAERNLPAPSLIVTDDNVAKSLEPSLLRDQPVMVVPHGEAHKNLRTVEKLYNEFLKRDLDRGSVVMALGGGVIGDTVGFAAATYMRGIRWVNAPTTLLSMVDASLGGKTGVNLAQGKNLVGAFHAPSLVLVDPLTLHTLPRRELISGMAEVIKHGIIGDAALFESLETSLFFGSLPQLARAIQVKAHVVSRDPFERGERAILNVGHTIGHGVEAAAPDFDLRHGEAVAIGLIAEARLAERLGIAETGLADRIEKVIQFFDLPIHFNGDMEAVRELMQSDKKKSQGKLKFALPKKIGEVVWGVEAEEGVLMSVLESILQ